MSKREKTRIVLATAGYSAVLRQRARAVAHANEQHLRLLITSLMATLIESGGIGIAAPQIGVSLQVCIIAAPGIKPFVLVNPHVVAHSVTLEADDEGCLSVPGTWARGVQRYTWIKLDYLTPRGVRKRLRAQGLLARVIQHELDHLDGKLILDRVAPDRLVDTDAMKRSVRPAALLKEGSGEPPTA